MKYSIDNIRDELLGYYFQTQAMALKSRRKMGTTAAGSYRSTSRGRGIDFAEVRDYQIGDDIRAIDWRVTARTGKTHTKVFHEEKERPVYVVVDQSSCMHFGSRTTFKSILAARVASWLAWSAVHLGDKVGGFVFDGGMHKEFRPKARRHGLLHLINTLAEYCQPEFTCPQNDEAFLQTLQRLNHVARPGSLVYIISDFNQCDSACIQQLSMLARHADVRATLIFDPLEREAPPPNLYTVSDGSQKHLWQTQSRYLREAYAMQFTSRIQALTQELQSVNIPLISLATDCDWVACLTHKAAHE